MDRTSTPPNHATQYELRYTSLFKAGRGFAFPCNPQGCVDLDELSQQCRDNYFYARSVIGWELSMPRVAVAS